MTLLKPAENLQAFAKVGIFGFAGSGKTFTATQIAIGLCKLSGGKKIAMFDTETGSDFIISHAQEAGVKLDVAKKRSFKDLLDVIDEAEKGYNVLVVDSITHVWRDIVDSYKKKVGREKLKFHDWGPIKSRWGIYTDLFVNANIHIIVCGRAGYEYDYQPEDQELIKTGTKMKVENEFGFEPSLVIEMERIRAAKPNSQSSNWVHVAHVLKDRTDTINGRSFETPTFESFMPHFEHLNIGGKHFGVDDKEDSSSLFPEDKSGVYLDEKKRRDIAIEKIRFALNKEYPGSTGKDANMKAHISQIVFGTPSKAEIEGMDPDILEKQVNPISRLAEEIKSNVDDKYNQDDVSKTWKWIRAELDAVEGDVPL